MSVISDRISKLTQTIEMKTITAASMAHAFVTLLVMTYGQLIWLFSDNGKNINAKFFENVCLLET